MKSLMFWFRLHLGTSFSLDSSSSSSSSSGQHERHEAEPSLVVVAVCVVVLRHLFQRILLAVFLQGAGQEGAIIVLAARRLPLPAPGSLGLRTASPSAASHSLRRGPWSMQMVPTTYPGCVYATMSP